MRISGGAKSIALLGIALALGITLIACNHIPADQEAIAPKLKIGVILPLTGKGSEYGQSAREGIEFALKKLAKEGREFELVWENDEFDVKKTVAAYHKLTKIDGIKIIIGPVGSTHVLAVAPLADKDHVLILSPAVGANDATLNHPYVYRFWEKKDNQMTRLISWVRAQDFKNILSITAQNDSPISSLEVLERHLGKTRNYFVSTDENDFRTVLMEARRVKADAIFMNVYVGQYPLVLKNYRELNIEIPVFATLIFDNQSEIEASKDLIDKIVFASHTTQTEGFKKELKDGMGLEIGIATANGHDAMLVVSKIVGASNPKLAIDNIGEIHGAMGTYRLDEHGDPTIVASLKVMERGVIRSLDN